MPDPAFIGVGTTATTATQDSPISPPLPAGALAGHLAVVLAVASNFGTGAVAPTIPVPTGYTELRVAHAFGFVNTRNPRLYAFARILPAGPTAPSLTMTGGLNGGTSNQILAAVLAFSDAALADVLVSAAQIGDTNPAGAPSPGTVRAGTLLLATAALGNSSTMNTGATWAGTVTDLIEHLDANVGSRATLVGITARRAAAGDPGAWSGTWATVSPWGAFVLALQPPVGGGDTTPPTISARTPAPGATGVLRTIDATVTFSEPMDSATVTAFTLAPTAGGGNVAATVTQSGDNLTWTLNPSADLAYATSYTATVSTAAKDVAGNALAAASTWSFTTEAAPVAPSSPLTYGTRPDPEQWALEVVDRNGVRQGTLEPTSFKITMRLNAVGELSGSALASAQGAGALDVYSRVIRAYRRRPNDPTLARTLRFAGHVHGLSDTGDADGLETVSFTALDPWANVEKRYQPWNSSWGPDSLANAVSALIGDASISAEDPAGIDASYPTGLGVLILGSNWPVGTFSWERHAPVAESFRRLQEGEATSTGQGFYWTVKPLDSGGTHGQMWIAKTAPELSPAAGDPRPLEYGAGTRRNLSGYTIERIPPINSVIAVGKDGLAWKNDSESSGATYGLWPTLVTYSDVTTTAELDLLARGVWNVWPTDSVRVEVTWPGNPDAPERPPMLWDDFDIGDAIPVLIRGARRTLSGSFTVREATVEVDADGIEKLISLVLDLPGTS